MTTMMMTDAAVDLPIGVEVVRWYIRVVVLDPFPLQTLLLPLRIRPGPFD
jgi:hypothetical protein